MSAYRKLKIYLMKAKPVIIIIVTLIIGFILGMLISAQIRYNRLKPVRVFFSEERFRNGFYNVIEPDEKQKVTIDQLLSKYAKVNSNIQNEFRKKFDSLMKDFWKELGPSLTKEQLDRLKEMDRRRAEMYRQNRRNPHDTLDFRGERRGGPPQIPGGGHRPPPYRDRDSLRLQKDIE
jgi:ElaB/YqjD/DUF883 family membrane-anchored ribosome-binding protein